jgi:hypothetical protein
MVNCNCFFMTIGCERCDQSMYAGCGIPAMISYFETVLLCFTNSQYRTVMRCAAVFMSLARATDEAHSSTCKINYYIDW